MRREVFPEFQLDIVLVSVPYPGASPEEVEEGICQKIEEAIYAIDGIKKMTTVSKEGSGSVVLELREGADAQRSQIPGSIFRPLDELGCRVATQRR